MFRAGHFVAAILCAVTFTVLDFDHTPPHIVARLQAEADARALADALQTEKKHAAITVCLVEGACK